MCHKCAKTVKRAKNVPACEEVRGQDLPSPFARKTEAAKVRQKTVQLYQYRQTVSCLIISRLDPNWESQERFPDSGCCLPATPPIARIYKPSWLLQQ